MNNHILKPEIRDASELQHHTSGPGERFVYLDEKCSIRPEFYAIGRKVASIPENQPEYISPHRHDCTSAYLFIGNGEHLEGLDAKINIEGQTANVSSPCSVVIPSHVLHDYKLTEGSGWFFHINMNPNYNSSLTQIPLDEKIALPALMHQAQFQAAKPTDRPVTSEHDVVTNPARWIFIGPDLFENTGGIYAALHVIRDDMPYEYTMRLHHHATPEAYLTTGNLNLRISGKKESQIATGPSAIYFDPLSEHKYEYLSGKGFILIVYKEETLGSGYRFTT